MNNHDDSDMKIVVGDKPAQSISTSREHDGELQFEEQKRNGNIARARQLGIAAADQIDADNITDTVLDDEFMSSRKLLMIFSIVSAIESELKNALLLRTALNVFYEILKKENAQLYDMMSTSGASTFYYLALRRGGNVAENIGKAFAMLCEKDGESEFIQAGMNIYSFYTQKAKSMIEKQAFV